MKITSTEFISGYIQDDEQDWNPELPQIVFYGRSNVGKSSTINALLNNKSVAKSSGTPGKTKEINLFLINKKIYFFDLPGYGFAKVSKAARIKLHQLLKWFTFGTIARERLHVFILDIRVGLTDLDKEFISPLVENNASVIVLLNKCDKTNQKDTSRALREAQQALAEHVPVFPFSAEKRKGVDKFWSLVVAEEPSEKKSTEEKSE